MTTERNLKLMLEVRNYLCVNMRYEKLKQTLASEKKGTQYEAISMEKYEHKLNALSIKYKDMKEVNLPEFANVLPDEEEILYSYDDKNEYYRWWCISGKRAVCEYKTFIYEYFNSYVKEAVYLVDEKEASFDKSSNKLLYMEESDEEIIKNLGILYPVFGGIYVTIVNYDIYAVKILKQVKRSKYDISFICNIYKNGELIHENICMNISNKYVTNQTSFEGKWSENCFSMPIVKKILDEMNNLWYRFGPKDIDNDSKIDSFVIVHKLEDYHIIMDKVTRNAYLSFGNVPEAKSFYRKTHMCLSSEGEEWSLLKTFKENGVVYIVTDKGILVWNGTQFLGYRKLLNYCRLPNNCGKVLYLSSTRVNFVYDVNTTK